MLERPFGDGRGPFLIGGASSKCEQRRTRDRCSRRIALEAKIDENVTLFAVRISPRRGRSIALIHGEPLRGIHCGSISAGRARP